MKRITIPALIFSGLIAASGPFSASADEEADQFIKEIVRDAKTNAERASNLHKAAKLVEDNPGLQVTLLEKAVEHGLKSVTTPQAREAVEDSLDLLVKLAPKRRDAWLAARVELYRRWFRATRSREAKAKVGDKLVRLLVSLGDQRGGDNKWNEAAAAYREAMSVASVVNLPEKSDVSQKLRLATHFLGVFQNVDRYVRALAEKPDNVTTRGALVKALVVDLDAPARAAKYLNDDIDETFRTYVPLVIKDVAEVAEDICRELGDWYYKTLVPKALPLSKPAMLTRAKTYYEQFLARHTTQDVVALKARMALKKIDKELEKLATAGTPAVRDRIIFLAKKSMAPYKSGTRFDSFPVQKTKDGLGPFAGKGVYFNQRTGQDVIYEIYTSRPIKGLYYKGAAIFSTTIEFFDARGKRIAGIGPLSGGNRWAEYTLKLPRTAGSHLFLRFHNTASTWFYIHTLKFHR